MRSLDSPWRGQERLPRRGGIKTASCRAPQGIPGTSEYGGKGTTMCIKVERRHSCPGELQGAPTREPRCVQKVRLEANIGLDLENATYKVLRCVDQ
jgi:hypothetical protein